jgi:prepilin-type N-terminal cleavage/methylation domain-containing protein
MSKESAFTLIELLVVIAIVGILAGIIIVSMSGATDQATLAKAKVFANSMRDSMAQSIVSEWNFDELATATSGATIKDSWGTNNGTLVTGSGDAADKLKSGSDCVYGKCLYFDGSNDYVDCGIGSSLNISDTITISSWVKFNTLAQNGGIFASSSAKLGYYKTGDHLVFTVFTDLATRYCEAGNHGFGNFGWHHVVGVYDKDGGANNHKIYLDGKLFTSSTSTGVPITNTFNYIGNGYGYLSGLIDEVRIYNKALSLSEIKQQYYAGLQELLANKGITQDEYNQRIVSLEFNTSQK